MSWMSQIGARRQLWTDPVSVVVLFVTTSVVGFLLVNFDPLYLYNDAFQHVSAARSLAASEGYTTSIIYYDQNYAQQLMPVPQTVWPPGIAALSSLLIFTGFDAVNAVSLVSIAGLMFCPLFASIVARQLNLSGPARLMVALSTIGLGLLVYVSWRAGTEGPFTAATLIALGGACSLSCRPEFTSRALLLIAAGTSIAVSIRYNGLFLVVSTGCWFLVNAITRRSVKTLIQGVISLAPAAVLGLAILYRNMSYTGSLTGGPVSEEWASFGEVFRVLLEAVVSTTGFNPSKSFQLVLLAVLAMAATATLVNVVHYFVSAASPGAKESVLARGKRDVLVFCLLYLLVSILMLVLVLAPRALDALGYRYLLPLIPYWVLIAAITSHSRGAAVLRRSVFYTMSVLLLLGNGLAFINARHALINDESLQQITASLSESVDDGRTLGRWLETTVSRTAPLLSSSSQRLGGLTGWPVLGLTPGIYSLSAWRSEQVHDVVRQYGVCYVLLHANDTEARFGGGRVFFQNLRKGIRPDWLALIHQSPLLQVFAVRDCGSKSL